MSIEKIIATNGYEEMSLTDFLIWELNGGKENVLAADEDWDSLDDESKIGNMAISMSGDLLAGGD